MLTDPTPRIMKSHLDDLDYIQGTDLEKPRPENPGELALNIQKDLPVIARVLMRKLASEQVWLDRSNAVQTSWSATVKYLPLYTRMTDDVP